jgi:hypothetical protein
LPVALIRVRTEIRWVGRLGHDTHISPVLPAIQVPTLVIHRRGDRLVNVRSGRYLAEHIPGARLVEVPGIDHAPFFDRCDDVVDAIEEFVTGTPPQGQPDRRLATVLFSDVVGSTERAAAIGDSSGARSSNAITRSFAHSSNEAGAPR